MKEGQIHPDPLNQSLLPTPRKDSVSPSLIATMFKASKNEKEKWTLCVWRRRKPEGGLGDSGGGGWRNIRTRTRDLHEVSSLDWEIYQLWGPVLWENPQDLRRGLRCPLSWRGQLNSRVLYNRGRFRRRGAWEGFSLYSGWEQTALASPLPFSLITSQKCRTNKPRVGNGQC